jgi:hypothetical protein
MPGWCGRGNDDDDEEDDDETGGCGHRRRRGICFVIVLGRDNVCSS